MMRNSHGIRYSPEALIKSSARDIGFAEVGIASVAPSADSDRVFDRWIADGKHGDMRYLSGGSNKRHNPALLLEGARSVVCVALNYYSKRAVQHNEARTEAGDGVVAMYAHGRDYHNVMQEMLDELQHRLESIFPDMQSRICVDTQPVSERDFAIRSGIAWLGKNTCVISNNYGSWVFLGELLTTLDLQVDQPLESMCGTCTRCIDNCPTGALEAAFALDATKCISYLTIEKRDEIAAELQKKIGNNVYGCDECQTICPFNKFAQESLVFTDTNPIVKMSLDDMAAISDEDFLQHTRDSAIRRTKAAGLRRNAAIVKANSRSESK